jgi:hypothetical protein
MRSSGFPADAIIWAAIAKSHAQPSATLFVDLFRRGSHHTGLFAIVTNFLIGASQQPAGGHGRVAAAASEISAGEDASRR